MRFAVHLEKSGSWREVERERHSHDLAGFGRYSRFASDFYFPESYGLTLVSIRKMGSDPISYREVSLEVDRCFIFTSLFDRADPLSYVARNMGRQDVLATAWSIKSVTEAATHRCLNQPFCLIDRL